MYFLCIMLVLLYRANKEDEACNIANNYYLVHSKTFVTTWNTILMQYVS